MSRVSRYLRVSEPVRRLWGGVALTSTDWPRRSSATCRATLRTRGDVMLEGSIDGRRSRACRLLGAAGRVKRLVGAARGAGVGALRPPSAAKPVDRRGASVTRCRALAAARWHAPDPALRRDPCWARREPLHRPCATRRRLLVRLIASVANCPTAASRGPPLASALPLRPADPRGRPRPEARYCSKRCRQARLARPARARTRARSGACRERATPRLQ